jgi:hypothetical protein
MRWTIGRTICLLIGLGLLGICVRETLFSFEWDRKFERWNTEVLARMLVDPSSTVEHSASLHHSCTVGHSQSIYLRSLDAGGTPIPDDAWPTRLDARIAIEPTGHPESTQEIESPARDFDLNRGPNFSHGVMLASPRFGPEGDYTLRFSLNQPHEALPGVKYEITARNLLCGLERMPGFIARVIAIVAGLLGLVFALPAALKIASFKPPAPKPL